MVDANVIQYVKEYNYWSHIPSLENSKAKKSTNVTKMSGGASYYAMKVPMNGKLP